ncbi:hemerythrin domain-containing protein [Telmatospirillum sp.]|uniref:bacteriohemerythrin n=1 Tax=Telmatospirillum sp. TaxID=2079197 RepID=UPI00283C68DD|nr:hemerythrin domain-containing protein [Telmatospirillum sp.]MDR3435161.1 hemerythrin domain-containing protein [Telmatospirillum sp.]
MVIEWTDAYRLGIPRLDDDHRNLVDILNRFLAATESGVDTRALGVILDQFAEGLAAHCRWEEALLDRYDYADRLGHAERHQQMLVRLEAFISPYKDGALLHDQTCDKSEFLANLLLAHIRDDDLPFKPYLMSLV